VAHGKSTNFNTHDVEVAINRQQISVMEFAEPGIASLVSTEDESLPTTVKEKDEEAL